MAENDVRERMVDLMEAHPEGMTILSIAEGLKINRNTVTKYIYELSGAGIIVQRKVGSAKLCFLAKPQTAKAMVKARKEAKMPAFLPLMALLPLLILSVFAQPALAVNNQTHPMSELTPIDTDLDMMSYDIVNITKIGVGVLSPAESVEVSGFVKATSGYKIGTAAIIDSQSNWLGATIPVSEGGTGQVSLTTGRILVGAGTSSVTLIGPTAANQVLRSTGTDTPAWGSLASADIPSLDASKITSGTLANARLDGKVYLINQTGGLNAANITTGTISDARLDSKLYYINSTGLLAANITTGTISNARLDTNIGFLNNTQVWTGTNTINALTLGGNMNANSKSIASAAWLNGTSINASNQICLGNVCRSSWLATGNTSAEINAAINSTFTGQLGHNTTAEIRAAQTINTSAEVLAIAVSRTDWTTHDSYPAACGAGQVVSAVGDTLTCVGLATGNNMTGAGAQGNLSMWYNGTSLNSSVIFQKTGYIGIGTTTPASLLDVNGAADIRGTLDMNNADISSVNALSIADTGDQEGILFTGSAAKIFVSPLDSGNSDGYLRLVNDGGISFEAGAEDAESMVINSDNNVGIGTTSPGERLTVSGTGAWKAAGSSAISLASSSTSDEWIMHYLDTGVYAGNMQIGEGNAGRTKLMIVNGTSVSAAFLNGNVGVGTTSPDSAIQVIGGICAEESDTGCAATTGYVRGSSGLCIGADCRTSWPSDSGNNMTGAGTAGYLAKWANGTAVNASGIYEKAGNVGIGTASPSAHIAGTALIVNNPSGRSIIELWDGSASDQKGILQQVGAVTYFGNLGNANGSYVSGKNVIITVGNGKEVVRILGENGNVGIGTSSPTQKLQIDSGSVYINQGDLKIRQGAYYIESADDNSQRMSFASSGVFAMENVNVGIGTTAPNEKLTVDGNVNATSYRTAYVNITGNVIKGIGGTELAINYGAATSALRSYSNNNIFNGKVLIGDSASGAVPLKQLDVVGDINATNSVCIAGDCRTTWPTSDAGNNITGAGSQGNVSLWYNGTALNSSAIFQKNGYIGIGTDNPLSLLNISAAPSNVNAVTIGTNNMYELFFTGSGTTNIYSPLSDIYMSAGTGKKVYLSGGTKDGTDVTVTDGNVGIGVSPTAKMHVGSVATSSSEAAVKIGVDGEYAGSIKFFDDDDEPAQHFNISFNASSEDLSFSSDNAQNIMYLDSAGNVGLGTASPLQKLDVNGNLTMPLGGSIRLANRGDTGIFGDTNYGISIMAPESVLIHLDSNDNNDDTAYFSISKNQGNPGSTANQIFKVSESGAVTLSGNLNANSNSVTSAVWVNTTKVNASSVCVGNDCRTSWPGEGSVNGSGTLNYIPKFTPDGTTLGDSVMQETTSTIGVGNKSLAVNLNVGSGANATYIAFNNDAGGYVDWLIKKKDSNDLSIENAYSHAEVMTFEYVAGGGEVGIGDTSPDYKLDVAGTVGIDSTLTMTGSAANIALSSNYLSGDGGDEGVYVDSSGDVGIGTSNPVKNLDVVGTVNATSQYCLGGNCISNWQSTGTGNMTGAGTAGYLTKWANGTAVNASGIFETGGNVGIGETGPTYKFQISGTAGAGGVARIGSIDYGAATVLSVAPGNVYFDAPGAAGDRMFISGSTGYVGIGTTSPDSKLDVSGVLEVGTGSRGATLSSTTGDNFELKTYTNTPNPNWNIGYGDGAGALDTSKEYITSNTGHISFLNAVVGIGTATPVKTLDVVGDINATNSICIDGDCRTSWPTESIGNMTGGGDQGYVPTWYNSSQLNSSMMFQNGTYIGIGITNASASLHIHDQAPSANEVLFKISTNADASRFAVDEDGDVTNDGAISSGGLITAGTDVLVSGSDVYDNSGDLRLAGEDSIFALMDYNNNDANIRAFVVGKNSQTSTPTALLVVNETGLVGLGSGISASSLQKALDVVGDINATSGLYVGGDITVGTDTYISRMAAKELDLKATNGVVIRENPAEAEAGLLYFGSSKDTNLYRSAADTLKTDDSLTVSGSYLTVSSGTILFPDIATAEGNFAIRTKVTGDADYRYGVLANGKMVWGDGTAAWDTDLYRSAANVLKTDDSLIAAGTWLNGTNVNASASIYGQTIYEGGTALSSKYLTSYTETDPKWNANYTSKTGTGNVVFSAAPSFTGETSITATSNSWGGAPSAGWRTIMGTSSGATWLAYGESSDTVRGGIQLLDSGGSMRLYASAGYVAVDSSSGLTVPGTLTAATIDTGSGAMELGDAAVANGDTNSIPTGDQVYDFVTGLGYLTTSTNNMTGAGTAGYMPLWYNSTALNSSILYQKGGNVSIGTTTTNGKLAIYDGGTGTSDSELLSMMTSYGTNSAQKALTWRDTTQITGQIDTRYDGSKVNMVFGHLYNGGYNSNDLMTILGNGNVGIGTTSPVKTLDVVGDINATGSIYEAGQALSSKYLTSYTETDPKWNANYSTKTGTGNVVYHTSPTLVTPVLGAASATSLTLTTDLAVTEGGTGASTLTDGGILLGSGTGAITPMAVLANGAIVVGDGTTDPVALTAFTSSTGYLIHEAGGLEADVSGYSNGLYGMLSGATADIDTEAELETALGSINVIVSTELSGSETDPTWNANYSSRTGTGNVVFSASPTFTGTVSGAALTLSGLLTANGGITADSGVFTVADATGAVHTSSTLDVDGVITAGSTPVTLTGATGYILETAITQDSLDDSEIEDNSLTAGSLAADSVSDSELDGGFGWTLDTDLNIDSSTLVVSYDDNRVGIGTAAPVKKLDVVGDINATAQLFLPLSGSSGGIVMGGDTNIYRAGANQLKTDDSLIVAGTWLNATKMNVSSTAYFEGKVGINTTAPARQLSVVGNLTLTNDTVARSDIYWDAANNRLAILVA